MSKERCPACGHVRPCPCGRTREKCTCDRCECPGRIRRVAQLLATRDDWIPVPHQRLEQEPNAGESSSDESEGARRARETRHNLAEITRLENQATLRAGGTKGEEPLLERARRHRAAGSYRELDQALAEMERLGGLEAWAAWVCEQGYAQRLPVDADRQERIHALAILSSWLPDDLKVPGNPPGAVEQKEQRDRRIQTMATGGASPQQIADREQVSLATVYRVIGRPDAAA